MMATDPRDTASLDRLVSRSVAVIGVLGLVVVWFASGRHLPRSGIVAFVLAYAVGKAVVAGIGLSRRWQAWPAVLAEGVAMTLVALIVWTGTKELAYLLGTLALLLGAGWWRSRVARLTSGET